ncbi:MAG: hypothetical protein IPN76_07220 [Saprospiraceae bacterium]|nr:hypothetical protein [Saprospiraceae bacterium]
MKFQYLNGLGSPLGLRLLAKQIAEHHHPPLMKSPAAVPAGNPQARRQFWAA